MGRRLDGASIDPGRYGWKSHYMALLTAAGYCVPRGVALGTDEEFSSDDVAWLGRGDGQGEPPPAAVRSSAVVEDSVDRSLAGSFRTHLGVVGQEGVRAAVADIRRGAESVAMGIVVQEMIDAEISGVAFSVNPTTYESAIAAISWISGLGSGLVSGTEAGHDVLVDKESSQVIMGRWDNGPNLLSDLLAAVADLAATLGRPVDIEWCIQRGSRRLFLLQVRPVVLPGAQTLDLSQLDAYAKLPAVVTGHSKIQLRQKALTWGIPMTPARIAIANARKSPPIEFIDRSVSAAGSSVVLLHPFMVSNRIVREFAKVSETDVEFFTSECRRYSIRQYPTFEGIVATMQRVLTQGLEKAALAVALEQEIWDASLTGIVRRLDDGYLVEVGLGHFVPKGYVQTSTYLVDEKFEIKSQHEVAQNSAYHFINGHVVQERDPDGAPWLDATEVRRILEVLTPFLEEDPYLALEFGLTDRGPQGRVYLIDAAESDAPEVALSADTFRVGIVSHGRAVGKVVDLREKGVREDLNAHLFQRVKGDGPEESTIFIAERASVDLLPLLYACPPGCGFVFEQASLLAHFAVVLRERGVPGAVLSPEELLVLSKAATAILDTKMSTIVEPGSESRSVS